jgi:antitoxin ParD1/3/4
MSAKHTLNVSLTQPLRDFVDGEVGSGRYQTASEVVRAALRLLQGNPDLVGKFGHRG